MPTCHTPCPAVFTGPYPGVAVSSAGELASDVHGQLSTERRNSYICTDPTDAKLFRYVCHKLDGARPVGFNVLRLCSELSVGSCEEQVVRNEILQGSQVCAELGSSNPRLKKDNFWVCIADQGLVECTG